MPEFNQSMFWLGVAGGALPDVLRIIKQRYTGFPEWLAQPGYYVGLLLLLALGGLAAWLGGATEWKSALAMGFTAPEVISRLVSAQGDATRGGWTRGMFAGFPLRSWWAS
jgi:hypothetical protein